jgi:carbon storage regulator
MLVLSRQKDEVVMIGDIRVCVVDIRGDRVRLGIEAPVDVPVHRLEVYEAIHRKDQQT